MAIISLVVGIILSVTAKKQPDADRQKGIICSIVGLVLSNFLFLACDACTIGLASLSTP